MANENKKVLIVEDDEFLADILVKQLAKAGFDTDLAIDAKAALEKIKQEKPSLVLLDLILPGMNGFEFLEKIKSDPILRDIRVIILSNLGQKDEIERGLKLGAEDFMVKANYDINEIIQKVKNVLYRESQ
ncbi:MAG: response regulator [Candidatus Nealsonbacteria bacterium]|nr:response regulator [Candidatus Nealsonbacteria bacterium]